MAGSDDPLDRPLFFERATQVRHQRVKRARRESRERPSESPLVGYLHDPVGWAAVCLPGVELTGYQKQALRSLVENQRHALRGPHGLGKTLTAAVAVLWFTTTSEAAGRSWKIATTASAWRQLTKFLWPEIRALTRHLDWETMAMTPWVRHDQLLDLSIKLEFGEAFAAASDKAENLEGLHAHRVLYVYDESKRLHVETPIPTPDGWKPLREIRVGDQVLDETGTPCRVTYRSPIVSDRDCYRVTFSDGASLVADGGHLWAHLPQNVRQSRGQTHANDDRYKIKRDPVTDWRDHWDATEVVETRDLVTKQRQRSAVPLNGALQLEERELPIPPYTLGAWLGDGSSYHGVIHSADPQVIDFVRADGFECRLRDSSKETIGTYGIIGLKTKLKELNLLKNKHIPPQYLRASERQRRELLAGLMDTDGTTMASAGESSPRVSYTSTQEQLAAGVVELVRSLGCRANATEFRSTLNKRDCGPAWIVRWSADQCPFWLDRKVDRWEPRSAQASAATIRTVVAIEPTLSVPTMCIEVDSPRHLYLAGDRMIPTHNTIPAETWEATEGAFSTAGADTEGEAYALAVSTPGAPAGVFHSIHARRPGFEDWSTQHVTLGEAVAAGRISEEWAEQRRRQWGERSAVYINRVLGEFAADDTNSVIPLSFVEAAVERWHAWNDRQQIRPGVPVGAGVRLGVDVARHGGDSTVIAHVHGEVVTHLDVRAHTDNVIDLADEVAQIANASGRAHVTVDADGMGAGTADQLRRTIGEQRVTVFHGAPRPEWWRDRSGELEAFNTRAAAWWSMRERLDPAFGSQVCLPPDDELVGDLTGPERVYDGGARIKLEAKRQTGARLGRSPDRADAVVMAFWVENIPPAPEEWVPTREWVAGANRVDWSVRPDGPTTGFGPGRGRF